MGHGHARPSASSATASPTECPPSAEASGYGNADAVADASSGRSAGGATPPPDSPPAARPPTSAASTGGIDASRAEQILSEAGTSHPDRVRALLAGLQEAGAHQEGGWCSFTVPPWEPFRLSQADVETLIGTAENLLAGAEMLALHPVGTAADTETASDGTRRAAHDLGRVRSLDRFCTAAGGLVDTICAEDGAQAEMRLCANFPVEPGVFVGFDFRMEIERDGEVKIRTQLGATLTGCASAMFVEAFLRAELYGYLEAQGGTGTEAVRLLMYGIRTSVDAVSEDLAAAMFDQRFVDSTERHLTGEDYVEIGIGANVSAGIGAPPGIDGPSPEGEVGAHEAVRIDRPDAGGELDASTMRGARGRLQYETPPFTVEGEVSYEEREGVFESFEAEVKGAAELDAEHFGYVMGAAFLSSLLAGFRLVLNSTPVAGRSIDANRAFAAAASFLGDVSGASTLAPVGLAHMTGGAESPLHTEQEIRASLKCDAHMNFELLVALERKTALEIGDNPRDPFYLQLESVAPLLIYRLP